MSIQDVIRSIGVPDSRKRIEFANTVAWRQRVFVHIRAIALALRHSPAYASLIPQGRALVDQANDALDANNPLISKTAVALVLVEAIGELIDAIDSPEITSADVDAVPDAICQRAVVQIFEAYQAARTQ